MHNMLLTIPLVQLYTPVPKFNYTTFPTKFSTRRMEPSC